jgi:hypothetical protein
MQMSCMPLPFNKILPSLLSSTKIIILKS